MWDMVRNILAAAAPILGLIIAVMAYRQRSKLQATQHAHDTALAEAKKAHELDLTKRKYQYEARREEYARFCERLDQFAQHGNQTFAERFPSLMQKMLIGMQQDPDNDMGVVSDFMAEVMGLMNEANAEHLSFKSETAKLRLVASATLCGLLDDLDTATATATQAAMDGMKAMTQPEVFQNPEAIAQVQADMQAPTAPVLELKQAIMDAMRAELDAI